LQPVEVLSGWMKTRLTIVILILFFPAYIAGAVPLKFHSINSLYGISVRATNSVCKDGNGFIWASSKTGILRLTDDDYRIYQLPYETSGAIIVRLIYENSKLIAYSNNGQIFCYDPVFDRFDLILNLSKYIENRHFDVFNLLIDPTGGFWIALNIGLYRYKSGEWTLISENQGERYSITWFDEYNILCSGNNGIWLYNTGKGEKEYIYEIKPAGSLSISSVFLDKTRNRFWMGTMGDGLFCYDFESGSLSQVLGSRIPKQPILAIEENSDTTLLIGIDGQGIWELDKKGEHLLNVYKENAEDPHSLKGNGVYDIFYDRGKRIWICTISGGVSFYELSSPIVNQVVHHANNPNSLVNSDVNCIIEDREGKLWFATNNGISCWDIETGQWKSFYNNKLEQAQVFLTLCEDDQGRIWAGSYSSGFYVLDGNTGRQLAHYCRSDYNLPNVSNYIFAIRKDSDGDLWIGGVNGNFICYLAQENSFKIYFDEPVSSFYELEPGKMLVGFSYGLSLLHKKTGEMESLLTEIVVQEILVVDETVWICTSGEGLIEYNYNSGAITKYNTLSGLPSNFINSIIYADGYLWLGTENGLCRFNPADKTTLTFQSIFPLSGISYNKGAVHKLKSGQLAWGTNSGAIIFSTGSLSDITSDGRIFFQDIMISGRSVREITSFGLNKPVDSLQSLNLKYFQNTISIELLSIGVSPGAKFSWQLEGFDKEWSAPTGNHFITYTNLPSGRYNLKVKLWDNSMSQVLSERTIAIRLIPPFWRKSWFWGILLVVLAGIVTMYILLYINRLKQKHNEEKIRFFTNTAHDIRTSLTLIKAPVEELSKETSLSPSGSYFLKLAIEQTRQLTSVVTQLMDFQKVDIGKEQMAQSDVDLVKLLKNRILMFKSVADSKNIKFGENFNCDSYHTCADGSKIEKVFDNLISNAVKYSNPYSHIQFDLNCQKNKWIFQVKDQGIGISKKAQRNLFKEFHRGDNAINSKIVGSGIGLLLVKKYITMHGGTISCESQENVGSVFRIVVPAKSLPQCDEPINQTDTDIKNTPSGLGILLKETKKGTPQTKEMKILIVEDNDDLQSFMKGSLEKRFKVLTAGDGNAGWKQIVKHMPDLVVSDIMMPGIDGFELCRLIKSTYETSHIPIILLTALTEKSNQLHGLGLGADDYLTKPFDMNMLEQKIKSVIHNREIVKGKALKLISNTKSEPLLQNEHNDKFVKRMLDVVNSNIPNSKFDKEEFALKMNVSSSLLYKKMKALTNLSPSEFVKTIRLNRALELLQSRKYSVTEVSELCGFASVGYFSTVFKKHFQKSPTEV
jgi:signal transduction histidine kinase/DNA-binding response OmpR family regulator/ligand-binding sensor domain-containing protein